MRVDAHVDDGGCLLLGRETVREKSSQVCVTWGIREQRERVSDLVDCTLRGFCPEV